MEKPNALLWKINHGIGFQNNQDIVLLQLEFLVVGVLKGVAVEGKKKELLKNVRI